MQVPGISGLLQNLGLAAQHSSAGWELAKNPCSSSWVLSLLWGVEGLLGLFSLVLDPSMVIT